MVQFDSLKKEISYKIVYCGPTSSGKTTNLKEIHKKLSKKGKSKLSAISADPKKSLLVDHLTVDVGNIEGLKTHFNLFSVPGGEEYTSIRKMFLQGVDGIVFIADSCKVDENVQALKEVENSIVENNMNFSDIPLVIQWNRRDLSEAIALKTLRGKINKNNVPEFAAVAKNEEGIFQTVEKIANLVIEKVMTDEKYAHYKDEETQEVERKIFMAMLEKKAKETSPSRKDLINSIDATKKNIPLNLKNVQLINDDKTCDIECYERDSPAGNVVVIMISGRIDQASGPQVKNKVLEYNMQGETKIILDLDDVDYIHSTGFGMLIEVANRAKIIGGDVRLIGVKEKFKLAFELMGIDSSMAIWDTEEEALSSFPEKIIPKTDTSKSHEEKRHHIRKRTYKIMSSTLSSTQNIRLNNFLSQTSQQKKVFISYASEDVVLAKKVESDLELCGYEVWRDRQREENDIEWGKESSNLVLNSNVVLVIWTEAALKSNLLHYEWITARAIGKIIIICTYEDSPPLPFHLRYLDTFNLSHYTEEITAFSDTISTALKKDYNYKILPHKSYVFFQPKHNYHMRNEEIVNLYMKLLHSKKIIITQDPSIGDMEGLGKTRLAIEFVYRFGVTFTDGVIWLNGQNNWHYELQKAAYHLGISEDSPRLKLTSNSLYKFKEYLSRKPNTLIVIDNLSDIEKLTEEIVSSFQILSLDGFLLCTTKVNKLAPGTSAFQLTTLSPEDSLNMMVKIKNFENMNEKDAIESLCKLLGGLPLTVDLVARYVKKTSTNYNKYLKDLLLVLKGQEDTQKIQDYHAILKIVIQKQYELIKDEYTLKIFKLVSFFPKGKIVAKEMINLLSGITIETTKIKLNLENSFSELESIGLIEEVDQNHVRMHPAVHAFMMGIHKTPEHLQNLKKQAINKLMLIYQDISKLEKDYAKRGINEMLEILELGVEWSKGEGEISQLLKCMGREKHSLEVKSFMPHYFIQQFYSRIVGESEPSSTLLKNIDYSFPKVEWQKGAIWLKRSNHYKQRHYDRTIVSANFSTDGSRIVVSDLKSLAIRDARNGSILHELVYSNSGTHIARFSDDNTRIVSSHTNTIHLWNAVTGKLLESFTGHNDWIYALSISLNGKWIAAAGKDHDIRVWNVSAGKELRNLRGYKQPVRVLCFSPDSKHLLSAGDDQNIKMWNSQKGQLLHTMRGHCAAVTALCFSKSAYFIASGGKDSMVKIWDAVSSENILTFSCNSGTITSLAFSPDDQYLVSGCSNNRLHIWDSKTGKLLQTFVTDAPIVSCRFSPDGKDLFVCDNFFTLYKFKIIRIN